MKSLKDYSTKELLGEIERRNDEDKALKMASNAYFESVFNEYMSKTNNRPYSSNWATANKEGFISGWNAYKNLVNLTLSFDETLRRVRTEINNT